MLVSGAPVSALPVSAQPTAAAAAFDESLLAAMGSCSPGSLRRIRQPLFIQARPLELLDFPPANVFWQIDSAPDFPRRCRYVAPQPLELLDFPPLGFEFDLSMQAAFQVTSQLPNKARAAQPTPLEPVQVDTGAVFFDESLAAAFQVTSQLPKKARAAQPTPVEPVQICTCAVFFDESLAAAFQVTHQVPNKARAAQPTPLEPVQICTCAVFFDESLAAAFQVTSTPADRRRSVRLGSTAHDNGPVSPPAAPAFDFAVLAATQPWDNGLVPIARRLAGRRRTDLIRSAEAYAFLVTSSISGYEQLANGATSTTLVYAVGAADGYLYVTSPASLPTTGTYRVRVGTELMKVTGVDAATLAVSRGDGGTTPATHAAGDAADFEFTKEGAGQFLRGDLVQTGTYAALPSSAPTGGLYFPTDAPFLYRFNGSTWDAWGESYQLTRMNSGLFTATNSPTVDSSRGELVITAPASATEQWRMLLKAVPAAPYTLTCKLRFQGWPTEFWTAGIVLMDSVGGKLVTGGATFRTSSTVGITLEMEKWTSATAWSASYAGTPRALFLGTPITWYRLRDDGATRYFEISADGYHWRTIASSGNTDWITPDKIGVGATSFNSKDISVTVESYLES